MSQDLKKYINEYGKNCVVKGIICGIIGSFVFFITIYAILFFM